MSSNTLSSNEKNISNVTLPDNVLSPDYDRQRVTPRIVHIGFGAFHRAHQALLTDRVLRQHGGDWGICEVVLFSDDTLISALRRQDHLFTVLEKSAQGNQAIIVGSVCRSLHARVEGIAAILAQLADPDVAIVSLTITEKGYCRAGNRGELDKDNPLVQQDIAHPRQPSSVPGILAEALRLRRERGIAPFSVLSCDNVPENGKVTRQVVIDAARLQDASLAQWITEHVTFPNTMVDRIVPAATPETLAQIAQATGVADPCGIACEPFIQWVVEDNFVAGRPAWEHAGVQLVDDVLPFEEMKLRMLNGSHSFLAYLGYLAGYEHINNCMDDANYRRAVRHLMLKEQAPTLQVSGIDLEAYAEQLLERFSNPALKHRTWQIAMDGSQKLPQRMLASLRWHLARGSDHRALTLGIAGWMRYVGGMDDAGQHIDIRDPLAESLQHIAQSTPDTHERVQGWLSVNALFSDDLRANKAWVEELTQAYLSLRDHGAAATVASLFKH
ncbi:mannitol dehydrogenase family protein [Dickeya lacustris]|uniref:Mannitol dehydrogenase family protein n=1 Tax=Dickeya lacustris TaxID=2259638 RepID=A0ABY8GB19_9GAMM|nr:mannitol dehydrogenase family protein [Dickeya lacustris]WFN57155.1 mannitol dehydrogenase family protein [Dickeya lacustris]